MRDGLVKALITRNPVIPAKAGTHNSLQILDSRLRGNDGANGFLRDLHASKSALICGRSLVKYPLVRLVLLLQLLF